MTQVGRSHPSHVKLLLASRLASEALRLSLFSSAHPVYFPPSSRQRNKGHAQRLLIFLAGRLPGWQSRKRKYAGDQTSPGATARGWSTVFTFLPVNLDGNVFAGRVATHLRKNAEPEWKRPRVKRYGRCARSPPLQRTSGTLTRRVLTLWNFCLLLARARSLWSV